MSDPKSKDGRRTENRVGNVPSRDDPLRDEPLPDEQLQSDQLRSDQLRNESSRGGAFEEEQGNGFSSPNPASVSASPEPQDKAGRGIPRTTAPAEPTLGELVSGLTDDITTLLRKEIELAAAEIEENTKKAVRASTMVAIGGFLGYAGLILLLIAASILLGAVLDSLWMGTAIVGLVVVVIAGILYATGKSKLDDVTFTPRKAMKSVERDVEMTKEKLS